MLPTWNEMTEGLEKDKKKLDFTSLHAKGFFIVK